MHELTELIRQDMRPALGVTEPGAIAFAVSTARRHAPGPLQGVTLRLNSGMFKNAFTCGIPGPTGWATTTRRPWALWGPTRTKGWNAWTASPV